MNFPSQIWVMLGEAVMRGLSRLEIANKERVGRTFVSCAQIENELRTKDDEIRGPQKTCLNR
jgi:hypothetical protein